MTPANDGDRPAGMTRSLQKPPISWPSLEVGGQALQALETAARRLITQMRPSEDWREVEELAIRVISAVGMVFLHPPDEAFAGKLRRALAELDSATLVERRAWAVRAVVQLAPEWQEAQTDEQRGFVAGQLVRALEVLDKAFTGLNLEMLGQKLRTYSPHPSKTPGVKGAERILAEIIVDDCDALGFEPGNEGDTEEAVDSIRRALVRDVSKYQKDAK